jgi:regulator of replication initiation timing
MEILLASLALLAALVAAVLAVWQRKTIASLKRHQDGLYEEISALAIANKRLVDRIAALESNSREQAQTSAESTLRREALPVAPDTGNEKNRGKQRAEQESLWQDVIFLAKQGLSADTIAKDLNITRGEVELILGLHHFKPKSE